MSGRREKWGGRGPGTSSRGGSSFPSHRVSHRSRLSNIHFLLLVFLKLPLFLGMVGAVLLGEQTSEAPWRKGRDSLTLKSTGAVCRSQWNALSRNTALQTDKRDLQILGSRAGRQQLLDSGRTQVFWGTGPGRVPGFRRHSF